MARSMFFQNKVVQNRIHFITTSLNLGALTLNKVHCKVVAKLDSSGKTRDRGGGGRKLFLTLRLCLCVSAPQRLCAYVLLGQDWV